MASVRLQPPSPFSFKEPDAWQKWKRRFEQYRQASGLAEESDERQVSTLLYCMGEDAEETLSSTDISSDDRKKFDTVFGKFDAFFKVRKNVIFERARFNRRSQRPDESVEQFITSLYSLADSCDYGGLREEMIRDRIVVGIRDQSLSERLQLDARLTLESAKTLVRQREAVREQQSLLRNSPKQELSVDFVKGKPPRRTSFKPTHKFQSADSSKCFRCGKAPHPRHLCPAKEAVCHKCKKKGHYSLQCRSKAITEVKQVQQIPEADSVPYDTSYLTTVGAGQPQTSWNTVVAINGHLVPVKLDTGAEVTVISENAFKSLKGQELQSSTKRLCGPDNRPLEVTGELSATLVYKERSCILPVFVVRKLQQNLLGLPAIQALRLLTQVDAVQTPVSEQYPALFSGLGTFPDSYRIMLKSDAQPFALFTPRNVPIPLRKKVEEELARMVSSGVISRVEQPSQWCAGMVVVPKKSGAVRICVDFRRLNESVLRETHPLPKVDNTLAQLAGATVFSKIDANSGFWQIPLDPMSRELTTFITPFGRFHFNRLPFGIASAPEHFQRQMEAILSGLDGALCHMDDVLIFGKTQEEHDARLHSALQTIQKAGVTLNLEKCEFSRQRLTFLGHVIDKEGVSPDPKKTSAIAAMPKPTTRTELRRLMGMANQLGKFSPNIAEITQPLRELLSSKKVWLWGPSQEDALAKLKTELTRPAVLALYDPDSSLKVSADASAYGLGAVLLQQHTTSEWKPVAFASRAMSETERRYSQIEKEALALVWACERFSDYVVGKSIQLETDHKPLVPLLTTTHLDRMPPRVLRFRLRLTRFDYDISHVPGKLLYTADTLSRAPEQSDSQPQEYPDTEFLVNALVAYLPADADRLECYRTAQRSDPVCSQILQYCRDRWPSKHRVKGDLAAYWKVRGELTICDDLLLRGSCIVVPKSQQAETLRKVHQGHQGIQRCRQRVSTAVWWPGVSREIETLVNSCPVCQKNTAPGRQPLLQSTLPDYPFERVASDLFEINGVTYLLLVDYFSRYIEVNKLTSTTSASVVTALKAAFSRYGIPSTMVSDNGPQYASHEMKQFAESYGFTHVTSSPHYPQSNGLAERAVKTAKKLLEQSPDPYLALLSYRATPLPWCGLSPAELLMGRRVRTDVPQVKEQFIPNWAHMTEFRELNVKFKESQKRDYNKRHRVKDLPTLPDQLPVWVETKGVQVPGQITQQSDLPRSYLVETARGSVRRNRCHLRPRLDDEGNQSESTEAIATPRTITTRSRTGTSIRPPQRLSQQT